MPYGSPYWISEQKEPINGETDEIEIKSGFQVIVSNASFLTVTNVPSYFKVLPMGGHG